MFAHDIYIATRTGSLSRSTGYTFLIASPYVRILGNLLRVLSREVPHPTVSFGVAKIDDVANHFASTPDEALRTRRVTLQMLGEVSLELVSLSGRNPLHSDLLQAIGTAEVALPYSLGVDVEGRSGRTRVNFDRHGNFWWYLVNEHHFSNVLMLVDRLFDRRLIGISRSIPLNRASDEEV